MVGRPFEGGDEGHPGLVLALPPLRSCFTVRPIDNEHFIFDRIHDLKAAREEWSVLALSSRNVFASWEWVSTWWDQYGDGRSLLATICRRFDGTPVAILPLYEAAAAPLRLLRFLGHGPGDQLGPIHAPGATPIAARALRELLGSGALAWDALLAERLPGGSDWSGLLGGTVLWRGAVPLLDPEGNSWDELLAARSSNFREQARRRERKLAREHELSFRLTDDPSRLDDDLSTLFSLHSARWAGAGSGALEGERERFHRQFAALALERGWLRLWTMDIDGQPAAAWYGLRFGGIEHYYQAGRDPAWDRYSAGFVLLVHTIREALDSGVSHYSFGLGDEPYKDRFANADPGLETVWVSRNLRGRVGLVTARVALSLPTDVRKRVARLAG